ncbi:hypothetical protein ACOSQ3_014582 [Xanthoceras sorbifolium]
MDAFNTEFITPYNPKHIIGVYLKNWRDAMESKDCSLLSISTAYICWVPPQDGLVKINVDRSRDVATSSITTGGVFMNARRDWILGFVANKGASCNISNFE